MSEYLGFEPSKNPMYFFLSYNSEDKDRISDITKRMMHRGINLWYDFGIDYGEKWEEIIAKKIKNSDGVLLLFTKGILLKDNSYVQKEYKIAEFLKRKIYIAFLDRISEEDVPESKISWWIDIIAKQAINLFEEDDISKIIERLAKLLNVQTHEDRMNLIISKYNELYFEGLIDEADNVLKEYLHSVSAKGKAEMIANIIRGGFNGTHVLSPSMNVEDIQGPLKQLAKFRIPFCECKQISVNSDTYTIGNHMVGDRMWQGDVHYIQIWKNDELIHTIGALVEAFGLDVFWDSIDNILYIAYYSDYLIKERKSQNIHKSLLSITVVEYPNDAAICTDFLFLK